VSSAVTGIIGLAGALGQAAGAAGLIPAALLTVKAVTATIKIGFQGVGDSIKALVSGDMAAFAESLKGLSPEAQKTIGSLGQFNKQIQAIKTSVQDNIFKGLAGPLDALTSRSLPKVKGLFDGIATSINGAAKETLFFLSSAQEQAKIGSLFANIKSSAANIAPALKPAISAFLDISNVGSSFLPPRDSYKHSSRMRWTWSKSCSA
jgi:phage-related protein